MLPNSIRNQNQGKKPEGNESNKSASNRCISDALKAMFHRLELLEYQKTLVLKYHEVSMQSTLNNQDTLFLIHIWEKAEDEQNLAEALSFVDGLMSSPLEGQELVSNNKNIRTYLSEHVVTLAEEKLKVRRGTYSNLNAQSPHVTMVCPDGSGIVNKSLDDGRYLRLDDDEICPHCNAKLSEHLKFISTDVIGDAPNS